MPTTILQITPQNINAYPWIKEFFDTQYNKGATSWDHRKTFQFNEYRFELSLFTVARLRSKPGRGQAYEMVDTSRCLGEGSDGYVYPIVCTVSSEASGTFRVRNKKRIVKSQWQISALQEYHLLQHAPHLHAKPPIAGYLIMREMPGQPLFAFLNRNSLTRNERLELSKALLYALRDQVTNRHLQHNDIHGGNIFVDVSVENGQQKLHINFIDFGFAIHVPTLDSSQPNDDAEALLAKIINPLFAEGMPQTINKMVLAEKSLDTMLQEMDHIILSPNAETQYQIDRFVKYLKKISKNHQALAVQLTDLIKHAITQSHPNNIQPIREAIMNAKTMLEKAGLTMPCFLLSNNSKKQKTLNQLTKRIMQLEGIGQELNDSGKKEHGQALLKLYTELAEKTWTATYITESPSAYKDCAMFCQTKLDENQRLINLPTDYRYIYGEAAIVLACLVVLYPFAVGLNYFNTGRFTFFGQTPTSVATDSIKESFMQLVGSD